MALVDAGLVRLEYFDVGSGDPTVVLVHGASSSARIWHTVQILLAQAGMRSLAVGMRGAGGSDRTTRLEDYTPSTYASDLSTALDALQVRRFVLVGHSLGVAVALEYMKEHAQESEVQALVLVAGGAGGARAAADANQVKQLEEALARQAEFEEWNKDDPVKKWIKELEKKSYSTINILNYFSYILGLLWNFQIHWWN